MEIRKEFLLLMLMVLPVLIAVTMRLTENSTPHSLIKFFIRNGCLQDTVNTYTVDLALVEHNCTLQITNPKRTIEDMLK